MKFIRYLNTCSLFVATVMVSVRLATELQDHWTTVGTLCLILAGPLAIRFCEELKRHLNDH